MEQFFIKKDTLEATAEAIRNKTGIKEKIKPADFPEKINEIETGVDVAGGSAIANDILEGKTIVDASGNEVAGGMTDNGAFSTNLSMLGGKTGFNIPKGYHNGEGVIKVLSRTKTVTPSKTKQVVSDWDHQTQWYLESVTVNPIPDEYQDVTPVTATAEDVRAGKVFVDAQGNPTEGTALIQSGMHLSIEDMVAPSELYQLWFRLNDTLYAAVGLSSSWEIYKYDDNSWVKVVDEMEVLLEHPSSSTYAIEYNGVIHFFARNKQNHYVFDGITLSQKSDLPDRTRSVCLYQGKIVNYMRDNCIYQWDEVTDTWTLFIENIPTSNYFTHIFTANGFLYVQDDTILYKFTNNEKEEVGNIPTTATQLFVKDNTVVTLNRGQYYNSPNRVYVYDLVTGTSVFLGNFPTNAEFMYICEDGSIRGLINNNSPSSYVSSFILEIHGTVATTNEDWIITLEDGSVITKKMMVVVTE